MDGFNFDPALAGRDHAAAGAADAAQTLSYAGGETLLQHTLAQSIGCVGIGLHSGRQVRLTLSPAPAGSGIGFTRTDCPGNAPGQADGPALPARHDQVCDTILCTVIGAAPGAAGKHPLRIGTIEHLMAALAGCGVDNAVIALDGPEVPILDGSADEFVFLIGCAGLREQPVARTLIEVRRTVRVQAGEAWAELRPHDAPGVPGRSAYGMDLHLSIDFAAAAIGRQSLALHLTPDGFRRELAAARTFANAAEIAALHTAGLALGGSLDNAVVVDGPSVLNPGGLRMSDEFVRHKLLDAVGDLALAGAPLRGRFVAHRTGHALNNRLLHALFADQANWRWCAPLAAGWREAA